MLLFFSFITPFTSIIFPQLVSAMSYFRFLCNQELVRYTKAELIMLFPVDIICPTLELSSIKQSTKFYHELALTMLFTNLQYTSIKPLGDRVLVKIKSSDEKTTGGILLPTTAQTKPQGGEVVAVGEGRTVGKNKVGISVQVYYSIFYYHVGLHV